MAAFRFIAYPFALCLGASAAMADPPVYEFDSIAQLRANPDYPFDVNNNPTFTAHVAAYYASSCTGFGCTPPDASDGGEGLFVPIHGNCSPTSDDGGLVIYNSAASKDVCWYRMNLNGDLRQFGVTPGSTYDCAGSGACSDAAPVLLKAITAAQSKGISAIRGSGMQIQLATDGSGNAAAFPLDGICYDGGANTAVGGNTDVPGLVWTAHGFTLANGACLARVQEQMEYYREHQPANLVDSSAIRAEMISEAQTGVTCTGGGCSVSDSAIAGFDTGIDAVGPRVQLNNVQIDADVGIYRHNTGGADEWSNLSVRGALTAAGDLEENFKITGVTASGGKCQITVAPLASGGPTWPISDIQDGAFVWITGLDSTTGAITINGRWKARSVVGHSDQFTLDFSGGDRTVAARCAGTALNGPNFTDATYKQGSKYIVLSSTDDPTARNINPGMTVSAGFPSTATVLRYWPGQHVVIMSQPATSTSSGPTSVTFTGGAFQAANSNCTQATGAKSADGACLLLTAMTRPVAGLSEGGKATNGIGAGIRCGGGDDDGNSKVSSIEINQYHTYGMAKLFDLNNCEHFVTTVFGGDSVPNIHDQSTWMATIGGPSKEVILANGGDGKQSQGVVVQTTPDNDDSDNDKGGVSLVTVHAGAYEVDSGTLQVVNAEPNADFGLVADGIGYLNVDGVMKNLDMYYYGTGAAGGTAAKSATDTHSAIIDSGSSWWGGQFAPGGVSPSVAGVGGSAAVSGNDSVGRFTVPTGVASSILTFSRMWANAPVCHASNETNSGAPLSAVATTSTLTINASHAGDTISYVCEGFSN